MAKNNWLIPSLIALGILSLALSLYISSQTERTKPGSRPLARIELNLGKVSIFRKSMTTKETLTRKAMLFPLDTVETGADGDATLEFDSSYRIRVPENTAVTLDEENEKIILILKRGDLEVENFGKEGSVYISKDGVRWTATDFQMNYKNQAGESTLPEIAPSSEGVATQQSEGLTSENIQETLKLHRANFFRCYTQLLQKTPGIVGDASISFTIERTGKVTNSEIASSSINDPNFKKCLLEATRRVEFKSFQGDPITTVFPLRFE